MVSSLSTLNYEYRAYVDITSTSFMLGGLMQDDYPFVENWITGTSRGMFGKITSPILQAVVALEYVLSMHQAFVLFKGAEPYIGKIDIMTKLFVGLYFLSSSDSFEVGYLN